MNSPSPSIVPFLMFEGRAEEAMNFYLATFPRSELVSVTRYGKEGPGKEGSVVFAHFLLNGHAFHCIDSPAKHAFGFTPSVSFYVSCATAAELDAIFDKLAEGGQTLMPRGEYPFSKRFGWVNDRFGVSWQLTLAA